MLRVLHLLTKTDDALAQAVIAGQRAAPDHDVRVVDLSGAPPDYPALLEEVFAADSVEVW